MTTTVHPITGNIVALDEQQRIDAITGAVHGPVAVLGAAPALTEALRAAGATLVEGPQEPSTTLIAVSADERLADELVEQLLQHASADGAWVADIAADDPARRRLSEAAGSVAALAQVDLVGSLLAPEHEPIQGEVSLSSDVPVAVGGHARRVILLGNLPDAAPASRVEALVFPHEAAEIARLRRTVRELELTNRRLAEGRLGVHDAAAARAASAVGEAVEVRKYTRELEERLESAVFHAKQNDELFQNARLQLFEAKDRVSQLETHPYYTARKIGHKLRTTVRNLLRKR